MRSRLPLALGLAGLVGTASAALHAETPPSSSPPAAAAPSNPAPAPADHQGDPQRPRFSATDRSAFLDARIAGLHAGLQLTPDQEKLWPPIESAIRDAAKTMAQMREARQREAASDNPVERLQRLSERQIGRGQAFKKIADAAAPLYATLNDEQKHRIPMLLHPFGRPRHRPMAMGEHRWHDGREHGWRRWGEGPRGWERGDRDGPRGGERDGGRGWRPE